MRFRSSIVAVVAASVLGSIFAALPASAATPKVTMTLKQSGTTVTVNWKYSGAVPSSQSLVVTPQVNAEVVASDTATATADFDTTLAETLLSDDMFVEEPRTISLKKTARSVNVTDLTPGTVYTFTLKSKKPTVTTTKKYTVLAKPAKPADVQLAWQDKDLLAVWDYEGPRVKEFIVTYTASGAEAKTVRTGSADTTVTIPNLAKNVGYTVTVYGTNAAGNGTKASETILQAAPNLPKNLVVRPLSASGDSVVVSWEYDGPAITSSRVQIKGAGYARDLDIVRSGADTRSAEITGLTEGGTYTFAVTVTNTEASATSNTDPYKVAKVVAAPTGVTSTPGNSSVALKWNAPTADAANPITGYRIDFSDNGTIWRSANGVGTATAYTILGLTNGIRYSFRVSAITAAGSGLASPVIFAPAGQAPTAPANLKVLSGQRQLVVSWSAPTVGGTIEAYKVEYKSASATSWNTIDNVTTTTTTITNVDHSILYSVRVYANGESGWSPASVNVTASAFDLPGVSIVTATPGLRKVDLKWTAAAPNGSPILGYVVEMQAGDSLAWNPVQGTATPAPTPTPTPTPGATPPATPAASSTLVTGTSVTVNNLTLGQVYRFRVTAKNQAGNGPESTSVSVNLVAAPESPTLTATPGAAQVTLNWVAPTSNGENVTAYKLERSTAGGNWVLVSDTLTGLTYTATSLMNGTKYSFRVSAKNNSGWSLPSTAAEATPITVPSAPTYLSAFPSVKAVNAVWQAIPAGSIATGGSPVTGYIVSYRLAGGDWQNSPIGPTRENVTGQIIPDLTAGTVYDFRVAAINAAGLGAFSPIRSATPFAPPGAVNNFAAVGKSGSIELTWTRPIQPVSTSVGDLLRYRVEYSVDNLNWEEMALVSTGPVNILNLRNGVPYFVRVTTAYQIDGTVYDGESVMVRATPRGIPDAPQNIGRFQDGESVTVFWDAPANSGGAPLGDYTISYSADGTLWSTPVQTTNTDYTFDELTPGVPYTFRLQSTNVFGSSSYATIEVTVASLPRVVSGLRVIRAYNTEVSLTWYASPSTEQVTGYKVERSLDGTRWVTVASNTPNTTVVVGGLVNGNTVQIRVSAINAAGLGLSASVSAMPVGPTSVTNLSATAGDTKVLLRWTPPTSGGAGVTLTGIQIKYQYGTDPVVFLPVQAANASTFEVTGLTNGLTYQFWVYSKTSTGDGTAVVALATPTNLIPDPVTSLSASDITSSGAFLTWVAPVQTGVGSISYTVQYRLTSSSSWVTPTTTLTETSFALTGLTAGSAYEVRVFAVNGVDASSSAFINVNTGA